MARLIASIAFGLVCLDLCAHAYLHDLSNKEWNIYKQQYNRVFGNEKEDRFRRQIWEKNVRMIYKHNMEADMGKHTYWLKVNKFADWTDDEYDNTMRGPAVKSSRRSTIKNLPEPESGEGMSAPRCVDWRKKGWVTSVKDQGKCSSCYAFAALGALEGRHFNKTGRLVSLSEQNIIDCTDNDIYDNRGCNQGFVDTTFDYVINNDGVDTDQSYPYVAKVGKCRFNKTSVGATAKSFRQVHPETENALKTAVANQGPIAVCLDTSGSWFRFYGSGVVIPESCGTKNLNHALVVVGYGRKKKVNYWILKNSYGISWGQDGYMYLVRGKNNTCGIASFAYYPLV